MSLPEAKGPDACPEPAPDNAPGRMRWTAVALLLALHAALLLHAAWRDAPTFDEPLFLAGGVASWEGAHHLFPEGSPLPQRLAGLALALDDMSVPRDSLAWRFSHPSPLGWSLLYESDLDPRRTLLLARLPVILGSILGCLLTLVVTRALLGTGPALLALVLHATSPTFLAHGHLATADSLAATTLLLASVLAASCLKRLSPGILVASCAATALAFLAKMSAILLPFVVLAIVALRWVARAPTLVAAGASRPERLVRRGPGWLALVAGLLILHAASAGLALWAAHGFRYEAHPEAGAPIMKEGGWETFEDAGPTAPLVSVAREYRLLPEAWLFGLQFTVAYADARRAFAEGEYSLRGWWWYFPRVVALKTPLSVLALACLGLLALARRWKAGERLTRETEAAPAEASWARTPRGADLLALAPLISLVIVYGATAVTSNLNIGIRHVLPILAPMLVLASAAWLLRDAGARWARAVPALFLLALVEGLSSHPDHLAWMNISGGPASSRWTHLADSNLDWGQGLRAAAEAVREERRPGETVYLSYFGDALPLAEGLDATGLASFRERWRIPSAEIPGPGLHVVSATMLIQLTSRWFPGPWRPLYERQWSLEPDPRLRPWIEGGEEARIDLLAGADAQAWLESARHRDEMIAARLFAYLRHREPLRAIAGGSMLLYRLDQDDLREAFQGDPPELETERPVPFPLAPTPGPPPG